MRSRTSLGEIAVCICWRSKLAAQSSSFASAVRRARFSIADAFFAPVCLRLKNYALPVPGHIGDYIGRVCAAPGVKAWIDEALAEKDFLDFEEPYRLSR